MASSESSPEGEVSTAAATARRRKQLGLRFGAGALVVAVVVGVVVLLLPGKDPTPETRSNVPAQLPTVGKTAKLPDEAKQVARRFVQTAVARKNLGEAYDLVSPSLRGGLTRKEWLTGNIPVVPYPIDSLQLAPFKIDYSYTNEALIQVALIPKEGAGIKPQLFSLVLKKLGQKGNEHWVVDLWTPKGSALLPQNG